MNPDDVYALLVDANPVPGTGTVGSARVAPDSSAEHRSDTMVTLSRESTEQPVRQRPDRGWHLLAAAAAVVAVVAIGAFLLSRSDSEPEVPSGPVVTTDDTLPAPLTREERAEAAAEGYFEMLFAGDVDGLTEITNYDFQSPDSGVRPMAEVYAVAITLGEPWSVGECTALRDFNPAALRVTCDIVAGDPVWIALGQSETEFRVAAFDDGTVAWPHASDDELAAGRAYGEYLQALHADQYDAVCSAAAYEPGTIWGHGPLSLTPQCAALWVPLGPEVAQWIEDGRPRP